MTQKPEPTSGPSGRADKRVAEIKLLFAEIRKQLAVQVTRLDVIMPTTPKTLITRLNELRSLQILLLKAEEAFHDKFGENKGKVEGTTFDEDSIRDTIGRRLDRIRATSGAKQVSERPDRS